MARSAGKTEYQSAEQIGVIYARYSSHSQKEESIEQQIAECTVGIYADKAVSGRSDRRPNFQRMMRDAEKRQFQIVVAYKSNRIARNMLNALQYEARLDTLGIKTLYAKEEFGNTAAGRFALRTMMNVNQFYSENMGEDIKRGMVDNANECKVNGMLPLGYVKSKDGKYAIAPDEAAVVRSQPLQWYWQCKRIGCICAVWCSCIDLFYHQLHTVLRGTYHAKTAEETGTGGSGITAFLIYVIRVRAHSEQNYYI